MTVLLVAAGGFIVSLEEIIAGAVGLLSLFLVFFLVPFSSYCCLGVRFNACWVSRLVVAWLTDGLDGFSSLAVVKRTSDTTTAADIISVA